MPRPLLLLLLLLSSCIIATLCDAPPSTPPDSDQDPFSIRRAVDAHDVAERNAERAISAADARAREAERRADASDVAAGVSRDLVVQFQMESNTRLARVQVLEQEVRLSPPLTNILIFRL
jgi:hypothetical protein